MYSIQRLGPGDLLARERRRYLQNSLALGKDDICLAHVSPIAKLVNWKPASDNNQASTREDYHLLQNASPSLVPSNRLDKIPGHDASSAFAGFLTACLSTLSSPLQSSDTSPPDSTTSSSTPNEALQNRSKEKPRQPIDRLCNPSIPADPCIMMATPSECRDDGAT
ncbi:hypothetical protein V5O48_016910 [Marasmius crinis-equi]|uniref:Uncharacterized protein n=1 Tax=Marasmius crinis-equi TaxID=585013 RepID=A0ABR3EQD9_9AGAR